MGRGVVESRSYAARTVGGRGVESSAREYRRRTPVDFGRQWRVRAQRSRGGVHAGGVSRACGRAELMHKPGPSRAQWAPGAEGRRGPIQGTYMVWGSTRASVASGQGSDASARGFDHKRGVDFGTGIDCRLVRANRVSRGDDRARTVKGKKDEGRSGKG